MNSIGSVIGQGLLVAGLLSSAGPALAGSDDGSQCSGRSSMLPLARATRLPSRRCVWWAALA